MSDFQFTTFKSNNGKAGAPVKYEWLRTMQVGQSYPIPEGVKMTSFRTLVSNYGFDSGKKFTVSKTQGVVGRIA